MSRVEPPTLTGTLHVACSGHQATVLLDGRVLATGGSDERGKAIGLAEIFNPVTGTWFPAAANLVPRLGHAASLLPDVVCSWLAAFHLFPPVSRLDRPKCMTRRPIDGREPRMFRCRSAAAR
jgi:hypothetical protein